MGMRVNGPTFIDFDAQMKQVQYQVSDHIRVFLHEWAHMFVDVRAKIDIKWENDLQHQAYRLIVRINNWQYNLMVDNGLFDQMRNDTDYLDYIRVNCLRACQTGILCEWLDVVYSNTEDKHDLSKIWREDLSQMVREFHLARTPNGANPLKGDDMVHLLLNDNPIPISMLVSEIIAEPKLLMARLLMLKA